MNFTVVDERTYWSNFWNTEITLQLNHVAVEDRIKWLKKFFNHLCLSKSILWQGEEKGLCLVEITNKINSLKKTLSSTSESGSSAQTSVKRPEYYQLSHETTESESDGWPRLQGRNACLDSFFEQFEQKCSLAASAPLALHAARKLTEHEMRFMQLRHCLQNPWLDFYEEARRKIKPTQLPPDDPYTIVDIYARVKEEFYRYFDIFGEALEFHGRATATATAYGHEATRKEAQREWDYLCQRKLTCHDFKLRWIIALENLEVCGVKLSQQ
jgi:hypothetical protein